MECACFGHHVTSLVRLSSLVRLVEESSCEEGVESHRDVGAVDGSLTGYSIRQCLIITVDKSSTTTVCSRCRPAGTLNFWFRGATVLV